MRGDLPNFPTKRGPDDDVYLQFSLQTLGGKELGAVAKLFGQMQEQDAKDLLWAAQRAGATLGSTNLVLVGLAGSGSVFHRDFTEACNFLMALVAQAASLT